MKIFLNAMVVAAAAAVATPALAADAFPSFTGVNGNGNFFYGFTDGTTLTAFTTNGNCALNGATICLHSATDNLPQASTGGSYPTVSVPTDAVLLHPGNSDSLSVYGNYVATVAGTYAYTINLKSVGNDTTDGIGYTPFTSIGNVASLGSRGILPTPGSSATLTGFQTLAAGQAFGVIVDRRSIYYGDSTAFNFSINAVPEPATWAMLLLGFGMIGFAMRKRSTVRGTVSYS
jgi:hypothetical protein